MQHRRQDTCSFTHERKFANGDEHGTTKPLISKKKITKRTTLYLLAIVANLSAISFLASAVGTENDRFAEQRREVSALAKLVDPPLMRDAKGQTDVRGAANAWQGHDWPGPRRAAGANGDSSLISAVDLLPTFCEIAGSELPDDYQLDGISQLAVLTGDASHTRDKPLFWKMQAAWPIRASAPYHWVAYAIVDQQWKLLANNDLSYYEHHEIASDPYEKVNLSADKLETAEQLLAKIKQWKSTLPQAPSGNVFSAERAMPITGRFSSAPD